MTYNQESYILDALNGFVMQETSFPVVSVIVDDASTDNEPQVILDYFNEHFEVNDSSVAYQEETDYGKIYYAQHKANKNCYFAIVLLKENHYSQKKSKAPYISQWTDNSKYIALCEGDDYWTDPHKLQRQVDYMIAHPDCMMCVHASNWETNNDIYPAGCQEPSQIDFSINELIRCGGLYFATASFLYKTKLKADWPEWRRIANVGDFPLQILAGLRGGVHYLPDNMCIYRYQSNGSWSKNAIKREANIAFQKNKIEWMTLLDKNTEHKYQKAIYDQLFQHYNSLYNLGIIGFWEYAKAVHKSGKKRYGRLFKDSIRIELTPLYNLLTRL